MEEFVTGHKLATQKPEWQVLRLSLMKETLELTPTHLLSLKNCWVWQPRMKLGLSHSQTKNWHEKILSRPKARITCLQKRRFKIELIFWFTLTPLSFSSTILLRMGGTMKQNDMTAKSGSWKRRRVKFVQPAAFRVTELTLGSNYSINRKLD